MRQFQQSYNESYAGRITVDGIMAQPTWAAFFDLYREDIAKMLDVDAKSLDAYVTRRYVDDGRRWIACGERLPVDDHSDGIVSLVNRRVELLFFHESDLPSLSCHRGDACLASTPPGRCSVYAPRRYEYALLEPLLEPGLSLRPTTGNFELFDHAPQDGETDELTVVKVDEADGSSGPIAWEFLDAFAATFPSSDFYSTPVAYENTDDE